MKKHILKIQIALVIILIALLILPSRRAFADTPQIPPGASAEVIEKKAREDIEERLKETKPIFKSLVEPEEPAEEAPSQTEFYVRTIRLEGNKILPEKDVHSLLSVFEKRKQTLDDLKRLCRQLEAEYQKRGYVAIVYLPPQRLEKQDVKLEAVVSKLGEVHSEGAHYFRDDQTKSYWRIPKGSVLRYDQIRTDTMRMNQNPDRAVRASLRPGKKKGDTDVYLQVKDRSPLHSGLSLDSQGTKLTGKNRPSFNVRNNNFTGHDDIFLGSAAFTQDLGTVYLYHMLPLPKWDLRVATHFSHAQVNPKKGFERIGYDGVSQDYGTEIRRWLFQRDNATLDGYAGFKFNEKRTRAFSAVIARDRLRTPYFGVALQSADSHGIWDLDENWTFGLPFHDDQIALTSRQAGSSFSKFEFQVKRIEKLPWWKTSVMFKIQGQWTRDNLTPQEEFFIGGVDTVRGYPESDYGGDYGLCTNIEYWVPAYFIPKSWKVMNSKDSLRSQTSLVLFLDQGYAHLISPLSGEHVSRSLLGAGFEIQFRINENFDARYGWGFPLGDVSLTEAGRSQQYFKVQSNY